MAGVNTSRGYWLYLHHAWSDLHKLANCIGGRLESHEYQLYLAIEDIDHTRTKVKSPQTNGICERFHKTMLEEFYQIAFRKKIYRTLEEIQSDLDLWMQSYNEQRPHSGRYCYSKMPMQTFNDAKPLVKEKMLDQLSDTTCPTTV